MLLHLVRVVLVLLRDAFDAWLDCLLVDRAETLLWPEDLDCCPRLFQAVVFPLCTEGAVVRHTWGLGECAGPLGIFHSCDGSDAVVLVRHVLADGPVRAAGVVIAPFVGVGVWLVVPRSLGVRLFADRSAFLFGSLSGREFFFFEVLFHVEEAG